MQPEASNFGLMELRQTIVRDIGDAHYRHGLGPSVVSNEIIGELYLGGSWFQWTMDAVSEPVKAALL